MTKNLCHHIVPPRQEIILENGGGLESGMVPDTHVRIIRQPYFGLIGIVDSFLLSFNH
ncbi:hypothetical protein JW865_07225 [Candidatus Bathyarchaeota archaeon]|nr:hypothetical protein [Candidatus Bathyarchaeota archaeon]